MCQKYYPDFGGVIVTEEKIKKPLLHIFRSSLPSNAKMFYEHHHTAFEITMVLEGSGVYATKASEFEFKSGDVFFFSTDEIHWIKKLNEETNFLNIHFEPRYIWSDNLGVSGSSLTRIFLNRDKNPHNKLDSEKEASAVVRKLIFLMEKEETEKKKEYDIMEKILLFNILVEMIRAYDGHLSKNDVNYNAQTLGYIEDSLAYIDEHLTEDLTLEEIAKIAHMSKNYFCRQFKKLNGISPWDYITVKRIEKAIDYIETTNLTRLEIAAKCGYNNTANFYYAFKKITGKNPAEYREKLD